MPDKRTVRMEWVGEGLRFRGGGIEPVSPEIELDPDNINGPSPMLALLLAAAGCTGADVVSILEKMRAGLQSLAVEVEGTRREEHPKRYVGVSLTFRMSGSELDSAKAERAVSLSITKYCSVLHSFDPAIEVDYAIDLA